MQNRVEDHEKRIETLENIVGGMQENFNTLSKEVVNVSNDVMKVQTGQAELAKGQKEIEVTMVKEGQANREVIKETKDVANKLLDHVLRVDEKEKDTEAEIIRKKAEAEELRANEQLKSDSEIRKARWELTGKILTVAFGAGGLITLIVQQFL